MILRFQSLISVIVCGCLIDTSSASPSSIAGIGVVMTTGSVQVDGFEAPGTTTIFAGNRISSGDRSAILQFSDGTSAAMRPGTTLTVYGEHSELRNGITTQRGVDKHPIVLGDGLRISGATPKAVAVVAVKDDTYFEVKAAEGESDVWSPSGLLVARVEAGKTMNFSLVQTAGTQAAGTQASGPAAGTQANTKEVTLCADLDTNYLIRERTSDVTYELKGTDLDKYLHKTIKVTGTPAGVPASPSEPQLLNVSKIEKKKTCDKGVAWGTVLILAAVGGALIGIGISGGINPGSPPATPAAP